MHSIYESHICYLHLPIVVASFSSQIQVSYKNSATALVKEVRGFWPDLLITVLCNEWRKCKRGDFITYLVLNGFLCSSVLLLCYNQIIFYL